MDGSLQALWPVDTLADHLSFAMRREDLDLLVLRGSSSRPAPRLRHLSGSSGLDFRRRAWFFYVLTGARSMSGFGRRQPSIC